MKLRVKEKMFKLGLFHIKKALWILPLVFMSCGKDNPKGLHFKPADNEAQAQFAILNSELICKDDCVETVGLVAAVQDTEEGFGTTQCTGTLVDKDVIATNSHCIPDSLKRGMSCEGRLNILLPNGIHYPCKKVLFASDINESTTFGLPDVAFFRIASAPELTPLNTQQSPLDVGVELVALTIDPIHYGDFPQGRFVRKTCRTTKDNLFVPTFGVDQNQSLVPLNGCAFMMGNSGSPLVDEEGFIRAIAFGILSDPKSDKVSLNLATGTQCLRWKKWSSPLDYRNTGCREHLPLYAKIDSSSYKDSNSHQNSGSEEEKTPFSAVLMDHIQNGLLEKESHDFAKALYESGFDFLEIGMTSTRQDSWEKGEIKESQILHLLRDPCLLKENTKVMVQSAMLVLNDYHVSFDDIVLKSKDNSYTRRNAPVSVSLDLSTQSNGEVRLVLQMNKRVMFDGKLSRCKKKS